MSSTPIPLPPNLPYPLRISSLDTQIKTLITKGTRLLTYSFANATQFGTWDAPVHGTLERWFVKVGEVLPKSKNVCEILEPCKHGVQIDGLCALCGKDMTNFDYNGYSDTARASIQMSHSAFGPTLSLEEAQRLEAETANQLLQARKLSLIVDLDQTIVHATVDPTVGEWIAEGEAWEEKQGTRAEKRAVKAKRLADFSAQADPESSSDSDSSVSSTSSTKSTPPNPNWDALKDVHRFQLGPVNFHGPLDPSNSCTYYIKPRPGWQQFLASLSHKYEMHVYTMGTRSYADAVCKILDPVGSIFGGRVLSRDESGSLSVKRLERLFPSDTSMVVIIDDRADVWDWSPNLVKVIPYDFYVGIGDINSTFLPKLAPLSPTLDASATSIPSTTESDRAEEISISTTIETNRVIEAQVENRPLAKKQEELQINEEEEILQAAPRKALLTNDDHELTRVAEVLNEIHAFFFDQFDAGPSYQHTRDVKQIIPSMRTRVLASTHILFSGIIPLGTPPRLSPLWLLAERFGATMHRKLDLDVTHVVASKVGTEKVEMARRKEGCVIVNERWLIDSCALGRRLSETDFLLVDSLATGAISTTPPVLSTPLLEDADHVTAVGNIDIDWQAINDEVEAAMNESDDEFGTDGGSEVGSEWRGVRGKRGRSRTPSTTGGSSPKKLKGLTDSKLRGTHVPYEDEESDEEDEDDFLARELEEEWG